MSRSVIFLFAALGKLPIGGYKVVYEYANRLAKDGYKVGIVYPAYCARIGQSKLMKVLGICKGVLRYILNIITKGYSCRNWFKLDSRVKEYFTWSLSEKCVPIADVYFATAIDTSPYLNSYIRITNERKYYLIQGFEDWTGLSSEQVIATYRYPMNKIVIAHWLEDIVRKTGEKCTVINDGFDFEYFKKSTDIQNRNRYTVCMLYHNVESKGSTDGFKALELVKEQYPLLQVNIFGISPRPKFLPDWYHYYQKPDQDTHNKLYNESAIFIGTSWVEGWGLTVGEAMMCGCAVACTDNQGYLEMAKNEETALVSPVKDPVALANNIMRLISDDALRYRIAEVGYQHIQKFTWESSYGKLKKLLER